MRRVATSTRIVGPTSAAVIKFGTHRLGQEAVHVLFRDGILGGIRFGLNRPEGAILGLGHKVNTSIRPPLTGPLVPQLDLLQLGSINRVGFQEPLADVLPLCAACLRVTIERLEEGGEAGRGHVGLAYRGRTAGSTERGLRLDNVPVAIRSYFRPVSTKSLDRDDPPEDRATIAERPANPHPGLSRCVGYGTRGLRRPLACAVIMRVRPLQDLFDREMSAPRLFRPVSTRSWARDVPPGRASCRWTKLPPDVIGV